MSLKNYQIAIAAMAHFIYYDEFHRRYKFTYIDEIVEKLSPAERQIWDNIRLSEEKIFPEYLSRGFVDFVSEHISRQFLMLTLPYLISRCPKKSQTEIDYFDLSFDSPSNMPNEKAWKCNIKACGKYFLNDFEGKCTFDGETLSLIGMSSLITYKEFAIVASLKQARLAFGECVILRKLSLHKATLIEVYKDIKLNSISWYPVAADPDGRLRTQNLYKRVNLLIDYASRQPFRDSSEDFLCLLPILPKATIDAFDYIEYAKEKARAAKWLAQEPQREQERLDEELKQQKKLALEARIVKLATIRQIEAASRIREQVRLFKKEREQKLASIELEYEFSQSMHKFSRWAFRTIQIFVVIGIMHTLFNRASLKDCNDIDGIHNKECVIVR